ncbi:MAG: hypothetical protein LBK60_10650 [Verrucomicrobiales bacterium]|nr:hypothetical protein [Verrucomicrobiales bacterium]
MKKSLALFCCLSVTAGALTVNCHAQLSTPDQQKNYDSVFGVKLKQRSYPYEVALIDSQPAGNVLVPGEQPVFTFLVKNNLAEPIRAADARVSVIAYGNVGDPTADYGNCWFPILYKKADLPDIPVNIDLPAKGSQLVTVSATLPETFGAYALVFDLGGPGRVFGTSCIRTFAPNPEKIQYPKYSLDHVVGPPVLDRLGVRAVRMEIGFHKRTDADYEKKMERLAGELKSFADRNITVLCTIGAGGEQPMNRYRPHLSADGVMLKTKYDMAWLPKDDGEFQYYVAALCKKFGWPNGPVTAVQLWNEPWEGISISGWGADMLRYREIYTAMARGVEEGRQAGAEVLVTGCDSSMNSLDKLFGDGRDDFLKWFDACTIHYQGMSCPVLYKSWFDRQGPNGRVKIWDTESWVANADDRVIAVIASNRAAGYDRSMGTCHSNISTPPRGVVTLPDGTKKRLDNYHVWSTAAVIGATQHFVGERDFRELLFKNGLPWVMVFDGLKNNAEDGTIVIVGNLTEAYGDNQTLFHRVRSKVETKRKELAAQLAALPATAPSDDPRRVAILQELYPLGASLDTKLTLPNPAGEFAMYDLYGNPVPAADNGDLLVPLSHAGHFLRANGAPGSFGRLLKAIAAARVDGYDPLALTAHDLTAPVAQKPALRLTLTNILNRPVSGSLNVTLGQLALDLPARVDLQAHETKDLLIPVTGGVAVTNNTYPLSVTFDAGADGQSALQENLRVNYVAKRTVSVDGNLDDWPDVLPQPVFAGADQGPGMMEAMWLPFTKFDTAQKPGLATGYLAHDDQYFYFAAKIADPTPDAGTYRFATRNMDDDFYPAHSMEYDTKETFQKIDFDWLHRDHSGARAAGALLKPGSKTERSYVCWVPVARNLGVDLDLPADATKLVSLYFHDFDQHLNGRGNSKIEVLDLATNKVLATANVKEYGPGNYLTFRLSGKVRIAITPNGWMETNLSGIFFDPDPAAKNPAGASAELAGEDLTTAGNWPEKYGKDGYHVFGTDPQIPAYAKCAPTEIIVKTDYYWPEGVRRYSYRTRATLPFGTNPKHDNVLLAFNVIPADQKPDMYPYPPGTMEKFIQYGDTDYEYSLNQVADEHGGGVEVWRNLVPGMPRKHFYARQPASPFDGPVKDAKLVVKYDGNTRVVEAALPWAEIPLVKKAVDAGRTVKFSFRVNDNNGPAMELAERRSVSKINLHTFHPHFMTHWANEVEFAFEK